MSAAKGKGKMAPDKLGGASMPLPLFLKYLTSGPSSRAAPALSMAQAIQVASKLIPAGYATADALSRLNQVRMAELGIDDEMVRKAIIALAESKGKGGKGRGKRKRDSDLDAPLPTSKPVEVVQSSLDFEEILHEETLMLKTCVTNRAPVMAAWACVVAERLNFNRQEALSIVRLIAQAYTDLNATAKGVSLGIYDKSANKTTNSAGPSQPFADLLGRRVPVLSMQDGAWRGISAGAVREPGQCFEYIKRSFRQQMGAIIGALRLLALSYDPAELNEKGYQLYIEFRPEGTGWGEKTEMACSTILNLRKVTDPKAKLENDDANSALPVGMGSLHVPIMNVKEEEEENVDVDSKPFAKRVRTGPIHVQEETSTELDSKVDPFDTALDDDLDLSVLDTEMQAG